MSESTPKQSPTGYALVAKRISGLTSNLLATAIILVGGLVFGRQITSWLTTSPQEAITAQPLSNSDIGFPHIGDPSETHGVAFGTMPLRFASPGFRR